LVAASAFFQYGGTGCRAELFPEDFSTWRKPYPSVAFRSWIHRQTAQCQGGGIGFQHTFNVPLFVKRTKVIGDLVAVYRVIYGIGSSRIL
jgi:hypothetical protein